MNEIILKKSGEPDFNSLPKGVRLIIVDNKPIFVRRINGRFIPLLPQEQEELRKKYIL